MKKADYLLLFSVISLCVFGLLMVYSSSSIWANYKFNDSLHYLKYQGVFFIIGFIIMMIVSKINYKLYYKYSNLFLIISFILLVLVLIPGIGSVRNGSRSWFGIGSFGIQPSEACKISLIIFTSKYLSKESFDINRFFYSIVPLLVILFLFFFLIMLQPDLGTGFIMVLSIISIIFISGLSIKYFIGGGLIGLIGIIILIVIAPYRLKRIISFIDPWKDELGSGFQIIQSLYAIGPGGILGVGYLNSIQKHFYLPEPQTDFIFSIISEEFGVFGSFIVVGLFFLLFYRGIKISLNCDDKFPKCLSFGILFQLIFQCILNLMVVVGLIPVTGVTIRGIALLQSVFSLEIKGKTRLA